MNGSGRRRMVLTKLKMAVFAPMPSASVSTATVVKPGFFSSWRKANFKSFIFPIYDLRFYDLVSGQLSVVHPAFGFRASDFIHISTPSLDRRSPRDRWVPKTKK